MRIAKGKKAVTSRYTSPDMGFTTVYPNMSANVPVDQPWVTLRHMGIELTRATIGRSRVSGILQFNVVGKIDEGTKPIYDIIDQIIERFAVGVIWTYSGTRYRVHKLGYTTVKPNTAGDMASNVTIYWEEADAN